MHGFSGGARRHGRSRPRADEEDVTTELILLLR